MLDKDLILNSLEVKEYRVFRRLQIQRLARVNLITGKNGVGKSCLLEALLLYASRGSLLMMADVLRMRDEVAGLPALEEGPDSWPSASRFLFFGRMAGSGPPQPIQIGPRGADDQVLSIGTAWYQGRVEEDGRRRWTIVPAPEGIDATERLLPGVEIRLGEERIVTYALDIDLPDIRQETRVTKVPPISCMFVPSDGLIRGREAWMWDQIALTDLARTVIESLRIVAPGIEGVQFVGGRKDETEPIPLAKSAGIEQPIPLRSLGEGTSRLFGIALALVNAKGGLLLIDEIDSGLHYSVQADLWSLVFQVARRLNVQVFATTHSWDCVEGFQQASREDGESEGLLIRLDRKGEDIVPTLFEENELAIATRSNIEVR